MRRSLLIVVGLAGLWQVGVQAVAAAEPAPKAAAAAMPKHATPQAAFDAYRAAYGKRDWRTVYALFTPKAQAEHVFEAFFQIHLRPKDKEVAAVIEKFGASDEALNREFSRRLGVKNEAELEKAVQALDPVKRDEMVRASAMAIVMDHAGFYEAVSKLVHGDAWMSPLGELTDLIVRGDTADGTVNWTVRAIRKSPGQPEQTVGDVSPVPFRLKKIGDGWFVDVPEFERR